MVINGSWCFVLFLFVIVCSWWFLMVPGVFVIGYLLLFDVFGGSGWSLAGIDKFKSEYNLCIGGCSET